jgi:hypothetical protein
MLLLHLLEFGLLHQGHSLLTIHDLLLLLVFLGLLLDSLSVCQGLLLLLDHLVLELLSLEIFSLSLLIVLLPLVLEHAAC